MSEFCNVAFPAPTGFTTCAPSDEPLDITAGTATKNSAIMIDPA